MINNWNNLNLKDLCAILGLPLILDASYDPTPFYEITRIDHTNNEDDLPLPLDYSWVEVSTRTRSFRVFPHTIGVPCAQTNGPMYWNYTQPECNEFRPPDQYIPHNVILLEDAMRRAYAPARYAYQYFRLPIDDLCGLLEFPIREHLQPVASLVFFDDIIGYTNQVWMVRVGTDIWRFTAHDCAKRIYPIDNLAYWKTTPWNDFLTENECVVPLAVRVMATSTWDIPFRFPDAC